MKSMDVQMKLPMFSSSGPISILSFLQNFETACESSVIHEGAATWLFYYMMNDSAEAAFAHCVCTTETNNRYK